MWGKRVKFIKISKLDNFNGSLFGFFHHRHLLKACSSSIKAGDCLHHLCVQSHMNINSTFWRVRFVYLNNVVSLTVHLLTSFSFSSCRRAIENFPFVPCDTSGVLCVWINFWWRSQDQIAANFFFLAGF